ncbi:lipopolysaccharide biosynthesis protein [Microbacterium ureisolvens]|uniref:lipopolysaccharide biosynthesis protein n=1 Tax=Microbacterium ureisolvens TaxID=2781186 RepID=UPI0036387BA4
MTEATSGDARLGRRAVVGMLWSAGQRWAVRLTGFITMLILTRTLSPEDFGTVAVAASLLPFMYLLADMGFSTYVVQAQEAGPKTLATAFWFTAGAGLVLSGLLVAVAPIVAALFDTPDLAAVVCGLVPTVLFVTLSTVPMSLLRRRMEFRALALQSVTAAVCGQVVAVALALTGFGVWALIAQTAVNQFVASVLAWLRARWRPSWQFSVSEFRAMVVFGSKVVGVELIAALRGFAENAIIAAALGVSALGYLNVAQRFVQLFQDVTAAAVIPVSTVVFAQVRTDLDRLRSAYLRSLGLSYGFIVPAMVFLAVISPVLIPLLFGSQWQESVPPSQVLAVAGVLVLGAMLDHGLFYGAGRPGTWLIYAGVIDGLTVAVAIFTAPHGLVVWALGFLVIAAVATVTRWPLVGRVLRTSWSAPAAVFLRAMLAGIAPACVGVGVAMLTREWNPIATILATGAAVLIAHLGGMAIFMRRELREARALVTTKTRPRRARGPVGGPRSGDDEDNERSDGEGQRHDARG